MSKYTEILKEKLMEYVAASLARDGYDFWNEHIKFVVENAVRMAQQSRGMFVIPAQAGTPDPEVDIEICELAALGHDISLPARVGAREKHEKSGNDT